MFKNYFKIACRNLLRHKGFSFINIMGLAIGMGCCLLILEFVFFEISFDRFNENVDQIYKVQTQHYLNGKPGIKGAYSGHGLGPVIKKDNPEVEDFVRLTGAGNLIRYVKGADLSPKPTEFRLYDYPNANAVAVVGSFNNWDHRQHPMKKTAGHWKATIDLYPERYEYKIFVDGQYLLDSLNKETIQTYGNVNSLLVVKPKIAGEKEVVLDVQNNYYADASLFSFFSFPLVKGSAQSLDELGSALISETTAKNIFGDEDPLDKAISVDGTPGGTENYIVKGIFKDIPENSHVRFNMLFSIKNALTWEMYKDPWEWDNFFTYIRVKPGTDPKKLEEKFKTINKTYFPRTLAKGHAHEFPLIALKDIHLYSDSVGEFDGIGKHQQVFYLLIIVLIILAIAYVNYINLTTVRSIDRAKEVGVRKVIGATRMSLFKQFLLESFLMSFAGLLIALLIVLLVQPLFNELLNKHLNLLTITHFKYWLGIGCVFLIGALLSGIYPAFLISSIKTTIALKGRIKTSSGLLLRKGLVVLQFAASITLIAGTFAIHQQIRFMQGQNLGFEQNQVLVVKGPQKSGIGYDGMLKKFKSDLLSLPTIEGISASSALPGKGYSWETSDIRRASDPMSVSNDYKMYRIDDSFLPLYKVPVVAGENFSADRTNDMVAIILTETACKKLGYKTPDESIHQVVKMEYFDAEVVGVVKDYHHSSLKNNFDPSIMIYYPYPNEYFSIKIAAANLNQTIKSIEEKYNSIFPGNTINYYFLNEEFDKQYQQETTFGKVFGIFAVLAIFVSCLGLFGLATISIIQRIKEIGVRKVLGAPVYHLCFLVSKDFLKLVILANLIALPVAFFFIQKWLQNYAFKTPITWWFFVVPSLLIFVISILTISFQTVKTAVENPVKALKYE